MQPVQHLHYVWKSFRSLAGDPAMPIRGADRQVAPLLMTMLTRKDGMLKGPRAHASQIRYSQLSEETCIV